MTSRGLAPLSIAAAVAVAVAVAAPGAAEPDNPLDRFGAYFEAHPEAKTTRSSGWKPYNRLRWLHGSRQAPEGVSIAKIRQDAFERARAMTLAEPRGGGWFSTGPLDMAGRAVAIDFHPTNAAIVYVGTAGGGLWKSVDGGDTWSTSTDDLPVLAVGAVCVPVADPNIVLIGTGEGAGTGFATAGMGLFSAGLLKSTDGGDTFSPTSLSYPVNSTAGFNVIEDNPLTGTLLAGSNDGLWRSTDDGDTWTQVLVDGNFFDVKWKPGSSSRVYVAKGKDPFLNFQPDNGIFVSDDDGLTFTFLGVGQPSRTLMGKTKIGVTPADPEAIYVHYVNSSTFATLGIYRSLDGGATWQLRHNSTNMTGGQGWYNLVMAVDPTGTDRIVTGGVNVYTSDDGGLTYTNINQAVPLGSATIPHWDEHALVFEPGSSNLWMATDGGPWRTTDLGSTWQSRREGIVSYQFYDVCVAQTDPFFTMAGAQDNGIPGRTDLTEWFESTFIADGFVCNIDPVDADVVYAEWQGGNHIKSLDGGLTWSSIQNGIFGSGRWITPVDQDQNDGDHLYTESSGGIFRTTNGGASWVNTSGHRARWISISPVDGDVVWTVGNGSGVWRTGNDGATWLNIGSFPFTGLEEKIHAHPQDVGRALVTYGGYASGGPHLTQTTDSGTTWQDVTGNLPDIPANTVIVDPDRVQDWYVGTDLGVWHSDDGGASWAPFGAGFANVIVTDLEIRRADRKLVAATYGRGVWEIDLPEAVDVGEPGPPVSRALMLDRPYPTPADGPVTFRFAARSGGPVTLRIVDVQGRLVDTVSARPSGDGIVRMVTWSPASVANGLYFAVLEGAGETVSRKVQVTR